MGKSQANKTATNTTNQAQEAYTNLQSGQTPLEKEYIPQSQTMWNNYVNAQATDTKDRGDIMSGYKNWQSGQLQPLINSINSQGPHNFTMQTVGAPHSANSDFAMSGYKDFANTGGYSPTDIQELRARGISPIRAAYGDTMMQLDRSRSLGGNAGSPNYIAARSKAQRELPGQLADATTGVNAKLAEDIRAGKLQGLAGVSGISEADLNRQIQASLANQSADLQKQSLSEQAVNSHIANQLSAQGLYGNSLSGMTGLYGTSPGASQTFGNQALNAYQNRIGLEGQRNSMQMGLLNSMMGGAQAQQQTQGTPWWQTALNIGGTVAGIPGIGNIFGGGNNTVDGSGSG